MEGLVFAAGVPLPVEFGSLGWITVVAQVVALVPLWLVARRALGFGVSATERPPLRAIDGGRELSPRVA